MVRLLGPSLSPPLLHLLSDAVSLAIGANPQPHHHTPQSQSDYHWFDGDGLLHSVYFSTASASRSTFSSSPPQPTITPLYSNKYLLTDVHLTSRTLTSPLLPSISSLQLPHSLFSTLFGILRAVFLCFLRGVARLSVANTNVIFHDGRALALCESGKAWEFRLPVSLVFFFLLLSRLPVLQVRSTL
jgi:hypothetical protein